MLRGMKLFAGSTILGDGSVVLILDPGALAAAIGVAESGEPGRTIAPPKLGNLPRGDGLLLFRAGSDTPKALRLASLLRIEEIVPGQIEQIGGKPVILYRGAALPLHVLGAVSTVDRRVVLIAAHDGRICGFLADAVMGTVDDMPVVDRSLAAPGLLGVATIAGRPVEIIDAAHYTQNAGTRLSPAGRSAA
jgi:two-component system, chemotaxis family, sensor kinase CheA